jgi:hypothetical protein
MGLREERREEERVGMLCKVCRVWRKVGLYGSLVAERSDEMSHCKGWSKETGQW